MKGDRIMNKFDNMNARMVDLINKFEAREDRPYAATTHGVDCILNEFYNMKNPLIAAWERHPAYDGDGKIVLSEKMYRTIDHKAIDKFGKWIASIVDNSTKFKVGDLVEVLDGSDIERYAGGWVSDMEKFIGRQMRVTASGVYANYTEYCMLEDDWHMYDVRGLKDASERTQDMPEIPKMSAAQRAFFERSLKNCLQFIKAEEEDEPQLDEKGRPIRRIVINETFPFVKAHEGEKTSRVINKICKHFGLDKNPEYNVNFTRFADAINPLAITRWTILSINPIDFLTMSFGYKWASCHTIDKTNLRHTNGRHYEGQYSGGTLSYMLDGVSFVMYTVDGSYTGKNYELQDKIQRQMFHFGKGKLIQGRLYPMDQEGSDLQGTNECKEMYAQFRAIAQRVISECFGFTNLWKNVKGTSECEKVTYSCGVHYRDYLCYSNCNVSYLKGEDGSINTERITIGADPICPECGSRHDTQDCIVCPDCLDRCTCEECGSVIDEDSYDTIIIDGMAFCDSECAERYGYRHCENDDEWHHIDSDNVYYDDYTEEYFYDRYGEHIATEDGRHFASAFNARQAGYAETDCGEWYSEDEVFYCEDCGRYVHVDEWNSELGICNDCAEERARVTA